jgi:hypothetical protein
MILLELLFATCFILVSCLTYYSTMKMEDKCSSETSVDFQWTTRRYIPVDRTLHHQEVILGHHIKYNSMFNQINI